MAAAGLPVRERIVEVIADFGAGASPRWRYGSGLLVNGRQVLTAAHVVDGADSVKVRWPDGRTLRASMPPALRGDQEFDVALLKVKGAPDLPPLALAAVDRNVTAGGLVVDGCWSVGYPELQEVRRGKDVVRETKTIRGVISPLAGLKDPGFLSLEVTARPREIASGWAGMSGAGVFAGDLLLGVVTEHAPDRGMSDLTVTGLARIVDPVAAPRDAAKWCARLDIDPGRGLPSVPALPGRREPPYRAVLRDIRRRVPGGLLGRERELDAIEAFAMGASDAFGPGTSADGYLWLQGEPWAGKTSLLAEAVYVAPELIDVAAFFVSARKSQQTQEQFFAAVVPQLAYILDVDCPNFAGPADFLALWEDAARACERKGRHLLLVVDGLDESPEIAEILPADVSASARVLVSSRCGTEVRLPDPPHPLLGISPVLIEPSIAADRVRDLAQRELAQLLAGEGDASLAYKVLGVLAAAGGDLSADDLAAITKREPEAVAAFLAGRARRSLRPLGDGAGPRYGFAHGTLRETCCAHPVVGDARYWRQIAEWADGWAANRWPPAAQGAGRIGTPRYLLEDYPGALAGAGDSEGRLAPDYQRLAALVSDVTWIDSAIAATGVDSVLAALRTAARRLPASTSTATMLRLVELQTHNLRPPAPVTRPGYAASQLASEALRAGQASLAGDAARHVAAASPRPAWAPMWTTERTSASLVRVLGRHANVITALAVTPGGKVVSADMDGWLRAWDPHRGSDPGRELGRLKEDFWGGASLTATPDGKVIAKPDGGVYRIWDPENAGGSTVAWPRGGPTSAQALTSDGRIVSVDLFDGVVRLWDPAGAGYPGRVLGRYESSAVALLAPQGGKVVSAHTDGAIWSWDLERAEEPGLLLGNHQCDRDAFVATPDGKVVTGGRDGLIRLWDPRHPDGPGRVLGSMGRLVWALTVTPDGVVVASGWGGVLRLWHPDRVGDPGEVLGRQGAEVLRLAATPDGKVVSGDNTGVVRLWDPQYAEVAGDGGHTPDRVRALAVTPDGKPVSGHESGAVRLWDPDHADDRGRDLGGHGNGREVRAVTVTPHGKVVSADMSGGMWLWDPGCPGDPGRYLGSAGATVHALTVTSDGKVIWGTESGVLRWWDPENAEDPGRDIGRHDSAVHALAVTPDGMVVSGHGGGLHVPFGRGGWVRRWDPERGDDAGQDLGQRQEDPILAVAVTPEGKIISSDEGGFVRLWDPENADGPGRELGRHESPVRALAATPDGTLVSGDDSGVVRLWDLERADEPSRVLGRLSGGVRTLVPANDGKIAATANFEITVFTIFP